MNKKTLKFIGLLIAIIFYPLSVWAQLFLEESDSGQAIPETAIFEGNHNLDRRIDISDTTKLFHSFYGIDQLPCPATANYRPDHNPDGTHKIDITDLVLVTDIYSVLFGTKLVADAWVPVEHLDCHYMYYMRGDVTLCGIIDALDLKRFYERSLDQIKKSTCPAIYDVDGDGVVRTYEDERFLKTMVYERNFQGQGVVRGDDCLNYQITSDSLEAREVPPEVMREAMVEKHKIRFPGNCEYGTRGCVKRMHKFD